MKIYHYLMSSAVALAILSCKEKRPEYPEALALITNTETAYSNYDSAEISAKLSSVAFDLASMTGNAAQVEDANIKSQAATRDRVEKYGDYQKNIASLKARKFEGFEQEQVSKFLKRDELRRDLKKARARLDEQIKDGDATEVKSLNEKISGMESTLRNLDMEWLDIQIGGWKEHY